MFEDADLELRAAVMCVMATTQVETDVDVEAGAETEATRKVGDMSIMDCGLWILWGLAVPLSLCLSYRV